MRIKKFINATMAGVLSLSAVASLGAVPVSAQGADLVVSAGGLYDYVAENISAFEEEYGVTVEVVDRDMFDALDGLALDGPAGQAADVLVAPYDRIGSLGLTGQIAEVTLNEEAGFDETDQAQVTADGTIYGAPAVIETLVMYWNTDLLDEAPATFADLEALAEDEAYNFESEEGTNVGFLAKWTDFYYAYGLIKGYGGYVFGDDGTNPEDIGLNTPGAIEGITYATDWFAKWPQGMQDVSSSGDFITQSFIDGNTAAIIDGPWQYDAFQEAGVPVEAAVIPTLNNGEEYQAFGGGKGWVVSEYSENKELAQQFLDWVTSQEQQTAMYEQLGEIPANHAARDAAIEEGNSLTNAVIQAYENADPMPNIPEMAEVWAGAENLMFDAASGNMSPEEAANSAVELIKQQIEAYH